MKNLEKKRDFLICHDYGMGGIWGIVSARSENEILYVLKDVVVIKERPEWMTDDSYERTIRTNFWDIDTPPKGWFETHIYIQNVKKFFNLAKHASLTPAMLSHTFTDLTQCLLNYDNTQFLLPYNLLDSLGQLPLRYKNGLEFKAGRALLKDGQTKEKVLFVKSDLFSLYFEIGENEIPGADTFHVDEIKRIDGKLSEENECFIKSVSREEPGENFKWILQDSSEVFFGAKDQREIIEHQTLGKPALVKEISKELRDQTWSDFSSQSWVWCKYVVYPPE